MSRTALIGHLSIPAVVTFGAFAVAVGREPFGVEMFSAYVLGGYLFYSAPHLLWAIVATAVKPSRPVWHAGFIASSIALAAIASLWLGPKDPSGLPLQWMLYWPLALVLLLMVAGGTAIYGRVSKTPKPSISTRTLRDEAALSAGEFSPCTSQTKASGDPASAIHRSQIPTR